MVNKRALVINTAFIGDVVFSLPLVENLGLAGYRVDLLTRPRFGTLAEGLPGVERLWEYDKRGADRGLAGIIRWGRRLRAEGYDLVCGAHPSLRSGLLARATGAARRVGWGPLGYHQRVQRIPRFVDDDLALAEAAGVTLRVRTPRIVARPASDLVPEGAVGVALGSRWATKCWPIAHWTTLVEALREANRPIVFLGSAAERELAAPLGAGIDTFGTSLRDTAGILAACSAVVGGDSGLMHVARAVDTPTVLLFGPTDPRRFPLDARRIDLQHGQLECQPCSEHGHRRCPLGHHRCMTELNPALVLAAVERACGLGRQTD